jgi:glycosyltransferase involved in cell wall biosynthesis
MRALYVNHTGRVSGGELSLLGLLAALPAGVEAAVACPEGELARRLRGLGVETLPIRGTDGSLRLHPVRTPRAVAEMGLAALQARRAAERFDADLVHANSIRAGLISVAATRAGGRPALVHVRDCLPPGRASALTLGAIGRAEALIANSAHTRARLGPARRSAHVVHNGIDLSRFERVRLTPARARARLGLDGDGPVLAVVAQITPWKGQDDAIRIAAALCDRHPGLRLLLVGSTVFDNAATRHDNSAYLEGLRCLAAELGVADRVSFLGGRDDVPEVLAAVDLLLAPSWEEPFGRVIVEAMAAGVPVAATSAGGPAEIVVDGRTGLLLAPRQPGLWAAAIEELLGEPSRLAEMGRRGRVEARRRFGVERHAAGVLEVYRAVLSGPRRSAGAPAR